MNAQVANLSEGRFGVFTRFVPDGNDPDDLRGIVQYHSRFAFTFKAGDGVLGLRAEGGVFGSILGRTDGEDAAFHAGLHPFALQSAGIGGTGESDVALFRFVQNGFRQWVTAARLDRCGQSQDILAVPDHVSHAGLPGSERPSLVKGNGFHAADGFQRRATLDEQATPRSGTDAAGNSRRDAQHQSAGAADQEQGNALVEPRIPFLSQEEGRDESGQRRNSDHAGRVPAAEAVNEAGGGGLAAFGFLDHVNDPRNGVVVRASVHADGQCAVRVDASGVHAVPFALADGNAFPSHGAVIQAGTP